MVEAEQVQHGGVEIPDGRELLDGAAAELIGRAVADASLRPPRPSSSR